MHVRASARCQLQYAPVRAAHAGTLRVAYLGAAANESFPIAHGPTLPLRMRRAPRQDWPWAVKVDVWPWEVPEKVSWQAGIVAR